MLGSVQVAPAPNPSLFVSIPSFFLARLSVISLMSASSASVLILEAGRGPSARTSRRKSVASSKREGSWRPANTFDAVAVRSSPSHSIFGAPISLPSVVVIVWVSILRRRAGARGPRLDLACTSSRSSEPLGGFGIFAEDQGAAGGGGEPNRSAYPCQCISRRGLVEMPDADDGCTSFFSETGKRRQSTSNGVVFMRVDVARQVTHYWVQDDQLRPRLLHRVL